MDHKPWCSAGVVCQALHPTERLSCSLPSWQGNATFKVEKLANASREPESRAAVLRTSCPLPARGRALGAEAHAGPVARGAQQPYAGPGLPLNERAAANGSRRRR